MNRRLLGLAFVALLLASAGGAVLVYRKAFTPVTWVTLRTDHTGNQLNDGAEVRLRGVVVGEVRGISSDGQGATLRLALTPTLAARVPAAVTARLLPMTLFGEKYIELVAPPNASSGTAPLSTGAVIDQDHSSTAVELERVLDEALPLLRAIHPDKLAATLGALAYALDGRGQALGRDIVTLHRVLTRLTAELPAVTDDVRRLASVLDTYEGAADDLLAVLRDLTVSARTLSQSRDQLAALLADAADLGDSATGFLARHGDQLITLGRVTSPVLDLLAVYAPEYPCLLRGVVALQPRAEQVFAGGQFHITLEITRDNGRYIAGRDTPVYGAHTGPDCRGLPDPATPAPEVRVDDGYRGPGMGGHADVATGLADAVGPHDVAGSHSVAVGPAGAAMGFAGAAEERDLIRSLVAAATGARTDDVPDLAVLLWGPLLRGTVVNLP
jgi:phospholipid/cholesterol/gamma-HCH transport system substrate-binding protein